MQCARQTAKHLYASYLIQSRSESRSNDAFILQMVYTQGPVNTVCQSHRREKEEEEEETRQGKRKTEEEEEREEKREGGREG